MEWERLTGVTGAGGHGSGYLVAPRLVLTSAHVVGHRGAVVTLFRPGRAGRFVGRVVWSGAPGGRDDAALVEIDSPDWTPLDGAAARWGTSVTHRPGLRCECWGVPDVMQRAGRAPDTAQLTGMLNPGDGMVSDRYSIRLDGHPPVMGEEGRSPWSGLSGAAVFCGDLLVGVIATDRAAFSHSVLEAVPAYVLHHDPEFRVILASHAAATLIEAAELAGLASPDSIPHRQGAVGSPAELLTARRAVVGFRGRAELLERLRTWVKQPGIGVWLLHGPGGQGKTRLAHHFGEQFAAQGGTVLWLNRAATVRDLGAIAHAVVPVLVVVDYAESRPDQLPGLLTALATRSRPPAVKVLALARTAGDWWNQLGVDSEVAAALLERATVTALPVLDTTDSARQDSYRAALAGFANELARLPGFAEVDWPERAAALTSRQLPSTAGIWTVLAVQMTALADLLDTTTDPYPRALDGDQPDERANGRGAARGRSPEGRVFDHERRYWEWTARAAGVSPGLGIGTLTDAVAATVLLLPPTPAQANDWFVPIPGLADQVADRRDRVRAWLAGLYPANRPYAFGQLEPDRLGEHLIGTLIADQTRVSIVEVLATQVEGEDAKRWVSVCARAAAHPGVGGCVGEALTRLCVENPTTLAVAALDVAPRLEAPGPLLHALDHLVRDPATPTTSLISLSDAMPLSSHTLADTALALSAELVARHRQDPNTDATQHALNLVARLNDLHNRLAYLGRQDEALAAITEAAEIYHRLAESRADAVSPEFAGVLTNLSVRLSWFGLRERALEAITEAAQTYRQLAEIDPDKFLPDLARSLNNLALRLMELGRREDALAAITETVGIQRQLAETRPDRFLAELAVGLNNLFGRLAELGRWAEAQAAITEAVAIRRRLAEASPDNFLLNLAGSLHNLSTALGVLRRRQEALAAITEAVSIQRQFVEAHPDAFLPNLALYLDNLWIRLAELGRLEDGVATITETVSIKRRLAETRPLDYLPAIAENLNDLTNLLGGLGRLDDAVAAGIEAVSIQRRLATTRPATFAENPNDPTNPVDGLDRVNDAAAATIEAATILRQWTTDRPTTFLPNLAVYLNDLSVVLSEAGRAEDAVVASTEAVTILRVLAMVRPDEFFSKIVISLNNLSNQLTALGRLQEANIAQLDALEIKYKGNLFNFYSQLRDSQTGGGS